MKSKKQRAHFDNRRFTSLAPLAREIPDIDSAIAEIARLSAELTLPKGTVHIINDIHGEDRKLRHVINNASGTLRPLVERLFKDKDKMSAAELQQFLTLAFYPAEVVEMLKTKIRTAQAQKTFAIKTLRALFEIVQVLGVRCTLQQSMRLFPAPYGELLAEILHEPSTDRDREYIEAIVEELSRRGRVLHLIHLTCRVIRNLAINELIIAGDCWDRGPRGDRVVDYLMQQPNVSFVWGNHDMAWLGAALGHEALICQVLRITLRYRRLLQLEEGYGVPIEPLETLVRKVYPDDSATGFEVKGSGMRDPITVARMQKAAAVMQFKLEGQAIDRHPEWQMDHRRLLHRIDREAGTIEVDGLIYRLKSAYFPTIDPVQPYELAPEERICLERIRSSFLASHKLSQQMRWI